MAGRRRSAGAAMVVWVMLCAAACGNADSTSPAARPLDLGGGSAEARPASNDAVVLDSFPVNPLDPGAYVAAQFVSPVEFDVNAGLFLAYQSQNYVELTDSANLNRILALANVEALSLLDPPYEPAAAGELGVEQTTRQVPSSDLDWVAAMVELEVGPVETVQIGDVPVLTLEYRVPDLPREFEDPSGRSALALYTVRDEEFEVFWLPENTIGRMWLLSIGPEAVLAIAESPDDPSAPEFLLGAGLIVESLSFG